MKKIQIGNMALGEGEPCFIIAEAGVNHEGNMDKAKRMVREAAEAGASAIKFQTYKAETLAAKDSPAYWDTNMTQREFFKKYDQFWRTEYEELAVYCKQCGIIFLSTPFDFEAVDFLDPLMPVFKVASADLNNHPFLRYIARKGKPVFLSTGASTIREIEHAIHVLMNEGNVDIVLLHCMLSYPTKDEDANLLSLLELNRHFPDLVIGYSDHTLPDKAMLKVSAAYAMGARVIEKHYTLDKSLPGNDHYHAMDTSDLYKFSQNADLIHTLFGAPRKDVFQCEKDSRLYARRSIVAKKSIEKGTILEEHMLTYKRPGTGISPSELSKAIGRKTNRFVSEDEVINWSDLL